MKLSKSQKKILKSIPNEKSRLEQKLQFKLQNRFFSRKPIVFVDGKLETDNPQIIEFLSQHPMCKKEHPEFQRFVMTPKGLVPMSDEISNMIDKGEFKIWYSTSAEEVNKRFDEFANEFISPEKESKVKVEIVKDEKLKGTGYENSFFKVTIPIGTPIQDSLNAVDEFFKQKPVNFPSLTSREKAMYKIIEMRREFDKSANDNPKQFTLEDMRKIYVNGILDNQNLLVTPETSQITFDMHLRNIEKNLNYEN